MNHWLSYLPILFIGVVMLGIAAYYLITPVEDDKVEDDKESGGQGSHKN